MMNNLSMLTSKILPIDVDDISHQLFPQKHNIGKILLLDCLTISIIKTTYDPDFTSNTKYLISTICNYNLFSTQISH